MQDPGSKGCNARTAGDVPEDDPGHVPAGAPGGRSGQPFRAGRVPRGQRVPDPPSGRSGESRTNVATMDGDDFRSNEKSAVMDADTTLRIIERKALTWRRTLEG